MSEIIHKLTSRKFWLAVAGVATGVAVALGADATEIESVAGTITALVSAVGYIITEGKIDTANARLKR
jgi:phage shock protein PspC (stress-responsive transcriptional regulator)